MAQLNEGVRRALEAGLPVYKLSTLGPHDGEYLVGSAQRARNTAQILEEQGEISWGWSLTRVVG